MNNVETGDDISAKYRRKPSLTKDMEGMEVFFPWLLEGVVWE